MEAKIEFLKPIDFNDNDENILVDIKKIRKGDVFYECVRGDNYQLTALTNSRRINDGWYCLVADNNGNKTEIFVSDYTDYPLPSLYLEPRFLTKIKDEYLYLISPLN